MADKKTHLKLVSGSGQEGPESPHLPPPGEEDPRQLFQLQVLEDLEEERALLYRVLAAVELIVLAILVRQIVLGVLGL